MMERFLLYDLEVAVLVAVFYVFYRLLLSRETFHHVNRVVLLLSAVASFVLPLCVITVHETVVLEGMAQGANLEPQGVNGSDETPTSWWQTALVVVFLIGVVSTLSHTLVSLWRVWQLISHSEQRPQADGIVICLTNRHVSPFSWMHYIVLSYSDHAVHHAAVIAHEREHIRLHHSVDVLLVDTLTALQWFNPTMWMLRKDLRAIHEYEADAAVLSQGINLRQYQYLLIQKTVGYCGYSVVNGITHSTLKNRINMMLHKKSSRTSLLKLLALLPIVGTVVALQARTVTDYVYTNPQKTIRHNDTKQNKPTRKPTGKGNKYSRPLQAAPQPESEKVFDVVEQMPQFPGGPTEIFKFLRETVKYPEKAEKAHTEGRVIATFIVEKDGSISNAKITRSVSEELDAEALRVVNAMPRWTPGRQNGKVVRVKYNIPITFRLK